MASIMQERTGRPSSDDRAGAAGALGAELLGAGEPQLVHQHVLQGPLRLHRELVDLAVDHERDGVQRHHPALVRQSTLPSVPPSGRMPGEATRQRPPGCFRGQRYHPGGFRPAG